MSKQFWKGLGLFAAGLVTGGGLAVVLVRKYYEDAADKRADEEIDSVKKRLVGGQNALMYQKYKSDVDIVEENDKPIYGTDEEGQRTIEGIPEEDYHRLMGTGDPVLKNKYRHLVRKFVNPPLSEFMRQEAIREGLEVNEGEFEDENEAALATPEDVEMDIHIRRRQIHEDRPEHEIMDENFDDEEAADEFIFTETTCTWYRGSDTYLDEDDAEIDNPEKYFGTLAMRMLESGEWDVVKVRNNKLEMIFYIEHHLDMWQDPDSIPEEEDLPRESETPRERMERISRQKKRELLRMNSLEEDENWESGV